MHNSQLPGRVCLATLIPLYACTYVSIHILTLLYLHSTFELMHLFVVMHMCRALYFCKQTHMFVCMQNMSTHTHAHISLLLYINSPSSKKSIKRRIKKKKYEMHHIQMLQIQKNIPFFPACWFLYILRCCCCLCAAVVSRHNDDI